MGILYKGIHPTLKRSVVIKKLIYKRGNPNLKKRFMQEATVMMDLNHQNIVRVFDHFTEGSNAYIVEEYIDGTECTVLVAAFSAVMGMIALNGLPRPHHPVFNLPDFKLASQDKFFLCIQSIDPLFDREKTRKFLEDAGGTVRDVDLD